LQQQQNYFFSANYEGFFNLKDQIKKNEFSIMKTPDQTKKKPDDFGSKGEG
jgi:hypothetical protein